MLRYTAVMLYLIEKAFDVQNIKIASRKSLIKAGGGMSTQWRENTRQRDHQKSHRRPWIIFGELS
jgi:hypothetical protein